MIVLRSWPDLARVPAFLDFIAIHGSTLIIKFRDEVRLQLFTRMSRRILWNCRPAFPADRQLQHHPLASTLLLVVSYLSPDEQAHA
jgi:hypothetical protein